MADKLRAAFMESHQTKPTLVYFYCKKNENCCGTEQLFVCLSLRTQLFKVDAINKNFQEPKERNKEREKKCH